MDHLAVCMEVGEKASKEYSIEKALREMKSLWVDINFL